MLLVWIDTNANGKGYLAEFGLVLRRIATGDDTLTLCVHVCLRAKLHRSAAAEPQRRRKANPMISNALKQARVIAAVTLCPIRPSNLDFERDSFPHFFPHLASAAFFAIALRRFRPSFRLRSVFISSGVRPFLVPSFPFFMLPQA